MPHRVYGIGLVVAPWSASIWKEVCHWLNKSPAYKVRADQTPQCIGH